jgi:ATP-binding cassette, subfamily B, bacterial
MIATSNARGEHSRSGDGILHLYRELWRHSVGQRGRLAAAMLLLVAAQCTLLAVPYVAGRAINALQSRGTAGLGDAALWLAVVIGITAGSWLLHGPGRILERNVALEVRRRVAASLTEKLLSLPLPWHEANQSGVTAHRVQQSSHALCAFAQSQFIYLNSAVRLIGPVFALWWLQPWVGIAAVAGFCVICLSVIGFDRGMIRLAHVENAAERRYAASLIESLGNSATLYALRQARAVSALLRRRLEAVAVPLRTSILLNEAKWCVVDISGKALSCVLVALFAWLTLRAATRTGTAQLLLLGNL